MSQGGTLNITNCNISACGDMWQGIINNGGTINITNSATIEDAIEAVHNQNNVILNITNNTFNGNNTDLFLDAGSYSTSKITGNTFTNAAGQLTKAPYVAMLLAYLLLGEQRNARPVWRAMAA